MLSTRIREQIIPTRNELQKINCWFSHDVTKIQTTKLSILLRFYLYGVLEQLKTNFQTNFASKGFLVFEFLSTLEFLSYCVTKHLHDGRESCHLG